MGALANALRGFIPQFWRSNGAGGLTSAQDARTYQEHVADAIEQLEARADASRWYQDSGAPAPALGQVYDQYLDNDTGDTWAWVAGQGWQRTGNLHGTDGHTPMKGVDYFDGRTPVKGVDYFDGTNGRTPVKGVDYFDGHTPVKGTDYFDGIDGSRIYQGSAAPTAADLGKVGDKFYHFISATVYAVYDYPAVVVAGQNPWRLRFTTPDPPTSTGGGTNYTLPQATSATLGGIKLGTGLTFNAQTGQVDATGGTVTSVNGQAADNAGNVVVMAPYPGANQALKLGLIYYLGGYVYRLTTAYDAGATSIANTLAVEANGPQAAKWTLVSKPDDVRDSYAIGDNVQVTTAVKQVLNTWVGGDLTQYVNVQQQAYGAPPATGGASNTLVGTADVAPADTFDGTDGNGDSWCYTYRRRNDGSLGWTRLKK